MQLRSSKAGLAALVLAAASALLPVAASAQAAAAGSRLPGPSRADFYGGYAYFHPFSGAINGQAYQPITLGAVASGTGYFTNHLGVQVEASFSPHGPNDCVYTAQAGPVYRYQIGRLVPFAHILGGGARVGGPQAQACTWGWGVTGGLGVDYILPTQFLRNRVAIRPIQADFEYADVNFGTATAPTFFNGGEANLYAYRLSAGVVLRLGDMTPPLPAAYGCEAQPVTLYPGDPVVVIGKVINLKEKKGVKPVYTWSSNGGQISGTTENATIKTDGVAPGDYVVLGHVSEGPRVTEHADCTTSFRVKPYEPPTIECSANPSSILPGGFSTITADAKSPQNRQLNYSYAATAGQVTGTGTTGTLGTADVSPGVITVSCNVVDDLGKSAVSTAPVTILAPPPPPPPSTRNLCSVSFDRDRKRPVRVDNEAKGCLDDIALELNREAEATLVIVGKHDPQESPEAAAERTLNVKQYLVVEKGIDPTRIDVRTGEATGRTVDNVLVPKGATWDAGSTITFDPRHDQTHRPTLRPPPLDNCKPGGPSFPVSSERVGYPQSEPPSPAPANTLVIPTGAKRSGGTPAFVFALACPTTR